MEYANQLFSSLKKATEIPFLLICFLIRDLSLVYFSLFLCLFLYLSLSLFLYPSLFLSISLCFCLSICLSYTPRVTIRPVRRHRRSLQSSAWPIPNHQQSQTTRLRKRAASGNENKKVTSGNGIELIFLREFNTTSTVRLMRSFVLKPAPGSESMTRC